MFPADPTELEESILNLLPAYGLDGTVEVAFVKQRENVVMRAQHGQDAFAVRIHRPGYRDAPAVRAEIHMAQILEESGVRVPEFITRTDGDHVSSIVLPSGVPALVDLQRWIHQAEPVSDSEQGFLGVAKVDVSEWYQLGRLIASSHQALVSAVDRGDHPDASTREAWDLEGLAGSLPTWGDPREAAKTSHDRAVFDQVWIALREQLEAYGQRPERFGPIHADFTVENVMRTPKGLALIDFDDFGTGWHLFDIATLLFHFGPHPEATELQEAVLSGYQAVRSLVAEDFAMLDAFILARGLTYLGWAMGRPGEPESQRLLTHVYPFVLDLAQHFLKTQPTQPGGAVTKPATASSYSSLLERRNQTIGPYSPLFYPDAPLELVSGEGCWVTDSSGNRFLDAYNNVPHVGHANPRVNQAIAEQSQRINVNTRYLNQRIVDYSETLLATFEDPLDRVLYGNSGSEANELAIRMARHFTGNQGMIVSDFSYHGTTITIAGMTTGLKTSVTLDPWVRTIRVPDLTEVEGQDESTMRESLAELDLALEELKDTGYGVAGMLFDPLFTTEGMPRVPEGYAQALGERVRAAGGVVISDEVQSGFGRTGTHMWGHAATGLTPDIVTLGKPMGNGHPMSGVVTRHEILDSFGPQNEFFNTFAGNPVSAAAGEAVLEEMAELDLMGRAREVSAAARPQMQELVDSYDFLASVRGHGTFMGLEFVRDGEPATDLAAAAVAGMREHGVLIGKIGRNENVLKMRPPIVFGTDDLPYFMEALDKTLAGL